MENRLKNHEVEFSDLETVIACELHNYETAEKRNWITLYTNGGHRGHTHTTIIAIIGQLQILNN